MKGANIVGNFKKEIAGMVKTVNSDMTLTMMDMSKAPRE